MPTRPARLLATFRDRDWAGGPLDAWAGNAFPEGVTVTSSVALLTSADGRLLLADVLSRGWDLPGGHVDPGETPEEALVRELDEEAGLDPVDFTAPVLVGWLHARQDDPARDDFVMAVYAAQLTGVRPWATRAPDEIGDIRLYPVDALPDRTQPWVWEPYLPR